MDYESILSDIGQFGRWQKWVFFLASLCAASEPLVTYMWSFVGFLPKFRCFVPQCEQSRQEAVYESNFTAFTIPNASHDSGGSYDSKCKRFAFNSNHSNFGNTSQCIRANFDNNTLEECKQHVYDSSEYEYPIVAELDLSSCDGTGDQWPLEESIK